MGSSVMGRDRLWFGLCLLTNSFLVPNGENRSQVWRTEMSGKSRASLVGHPDAIGFQVLPTEMSFSTGTAVTDNNLESPDVLGLKYGFMRELVAVVSFLVPILCAGQMSDRIQSASSLGDVREAVLRYQISSWDLAADSYCVKVDGKDAPKSFLSRLDPLRVKPASACKKQSPPKLPKFMYSIVDKKTKKTSVIFAW